MKQPKKAEGWRGASFKFGSEDRQDSPVMDPPEESEKKDSCCEKKPCGRGCYVATVNVDRLDQQ